MQYITARLQRDPHNPLDVCEHGSAGVYKIVYPTHLDPSGEAGFTAGYHGIGPNALALALTYRVFGSAGTDSTRTNAILENLVSHLPLNCGWTISKDQIWKAAAGKTPEFIQLGLPMFL